MWADSVVLSTPAESVVTHSDANGIITIADETSKTGIQQGSGSYKISNGSESYIPMKLSGSRQFNLTFSNSVTITKATLYATSNDNSKTATLGTSSSDRTSLGTMPVRGSENPLVVDLLTNNITGLNASSQFLAIIVVEYSTSAPSLSVSPKTLSLALNPSKQEAVENFTLTGKNLTNGEYSLTIPNLAGLEVNPSSFTVTDGQANQVFTVKYATTTNVAKATANITATVGELTATVAITYQSRVTPYSQSTVSADATWDWSKLTEQVELTDDTWPTKNEEFLLADLDDRITFNDAFGNPAAIIMSYMQYPSRGGYAQGEAIKFKTSVAGTISAVFSNTGGNRPYRYLFVNGEPTEFKSNATDWVTAEGINVPAGEVTLSAWLPTDGDESTNIKDGAASMLRWQKITFTASQEPVEEPTEKTWQQATSIAVGDVVLITNTDASKELKEIGSNNIGVVDAYESTPSGLFPLTVVEGASTGSLAFKTADGKYLAWSGGNTLTTSDEVNNSSSWTVTFTEGVPTILNVADNNRKLQYNSGSPRFCAYTTNQQPVTFWKQVEVAADTRTATTLTIAEAPTTGETGTTIALPTATVTAGEAEVSGATVTWTSDNEEVAKIEGSNINLLKAGTAKITASYAGDDTYKASDKSFILTVSDAPYTSLQALQGAATTTSTPANISFSNVQVVFVNGSNAYIADADGYGALIYTSNHGLEAGQVLNGTISCKFILYQGNTEITNFSKEGLTITTADVTPIEKTLPLTTANQSTLVTLKGLTYNSSDQTFGDGTNTIKFYDKFNTNVALEDGKTYDVTGIIVLYNDVIEICPRTAEDIKEAVDEPIGEDVTATWDFRGETPTPATLTKVNVESKATYYPSNNAIAALYVNALNGKLAYNSSGYAQFNAGAILRVPVYTTDDVVTVTAFPGQYKYTIGGSAATADETVHTATAEEVSKGYVEIVATGGAYLYAITMKTTQTAAKHAVWNFLNEIPTTITGTEINSTTGSVASSVEGIALDVNGYLKARGTDGWIKTNTTMNVPVKTEGDIVTVMAYSTQYDNYTVGGKDASSSESPIFTYKATTTDATNGYVTIATSDQQAYIYAISVQQLPVKEPTILDNEPATVTFPFNRGTEGQKATFSNKDYWLNSKVVLGSNMGYASTRSIGDVTFTKIQPQTAAASAAAEDYVLFRVQPKPGFTFTPTSVSLNAYKDGTGNGKLTIKWVTYDGTETELAKDVDIQRNDATPAFSSLEYNDLSGVTPLEGYCGLKVYIGGNLANNKQVGLSNICINGTLSGTEKELPILASFKANGTEYTVDEVFGDEYEATLELSKTETIVSENNPLTEITATSGEVGKVVYADATESSCKVTIPVTAGNTTLDYVLNVVHKPDFTLTYYNVSGEEIGTQTVEKDAKIGEFDYNIADIQAKTDGYKARGWFKNNYVGEKWTTESVITADAKLYAVETEIEVSSDFKEYEYDLTDKNFDANDHEAFNPIGNGKYHNEHGWIFGNGDKIELLVGKKATIIIGLCKYSAAGSTISASNDKSIDAVVESCGSTGAIEYEGKAGTLTLTINFTGSGSVYIHSIDILNTTTTNYEVNGDWIIVKEDDASSLAAAIKAAKDGARIFVPNGTYDLGQKTKTTIGSNNVSLIGESMEGVIIKNTPTTEGIDVTATLLNTSSNLYMQDLTIECNAPWIGNAERGVTLQDKGNQTILKNVYLKGKQDTYYSNNPSGTFYFENGKVEGSVDYVCGNGDVYFNKTLFYTVNKSTGTKGGCIAAPNTRKDFGYIFNECTLDGVANEDGQYRLGRPWAANTKCLFVNTTMKIKPNAAGWGEWNTPNAVNRFAEYNSVDANGDAIDLTGRAKTIGGQTNDPVLTETEAAALAPNVIFNGEWKPQVIAQQVDAPKATLINDGKKITWTPANDGATAYAIFKDGKFLGITTGNEWTIEEVASAPALRRAEEPEKTGYTIRAANSRGGFGEPVLVSYATGIAAIEAELGGDVKIYDLNGRRVMTPTKGVYIINGKKVVIK